jgi:hypothetical protein
MYRNFMPDGWHYFLTGHSLITFRKSFFMKKIAGIFLGFISLLMVSCGNGNSSQKSVDTASAASSSIDSAANNGVLPPSAAPGNAGNSSLADTTYKDTSTKK